MFEGNRFFIELESTLFDKIKKQRNIAYIDYKQDGKFYLLDEILAPSDYNYEYRTYLQPDVDNAGIVLMQVYQNDYSSVLALIENLPSKIKVLLGKEKYDKYMTAVEKFGELFETCVK